MKKKKAALPVRIWRFSIRKCKGLAYHSIIALPFFHFVRNTRHTPVPCTLRMWFIQKILGFNKKAYWPVHFSSKINLPKNMVIGVETSPGYEPGCYVQGIGKVYIGDYTLVAQNVGIISSNHDIYDTSKHDHSTEVRIGNYCWLGMNSVILPEVVLGDFTIVGAGAVVTRSFPDGYCVLGGNPARIIKQLEKEKCIRHKNEPEYIGYIPRAKFDQFRREKLKA